MFSNSLFHKVVKVPIILYTFFVLLFGMSQMNMDMNSMDGKANCPLGGHSVAICQMNPMEHIQEWQIMFTMLPAQNIIIIFFGLFVFLAMSKLRFWNRFPIPGLSFSTPIKQSLILNNFKIFSPLQEALSQGVLNPKLF